jgi:hypothetical protein
LRGRRAAHAFGGKPGRLRYSVGTTWRGELPVLFVLQAGKSPHRLVGQIDVAQLQKALTESVNKKQVK